MSKAGFGEHLKREREMRGVSLDEICVATRISTRFLEALESEHWEVLPGGVFNRGFVRAVSRFLGLDEEGMVAEYAMAMSEQNPAPAWSRPPIPAPVQERNWIVWVLVVAVLLLAGAGWFGWRLRARYKARQIAARNAAAATIASSPIVSVPASLPVPGAGGSDASGSDAASSPAALAPGQSIDGSLELKIEADKPTLINVEADGLPLFNGQIPASQSRVFYAQTEFQIAARDAGALALQLNGQALPPMGAPGNPGKVTLTRSDLKPPAGGAH